MPPLQLTGIVTKAGYMNKTVTVTVQRWIEHSKTGKVRSLDIFRVKQSYADLRFCAESAQT